MCFMEQYSDIGNYSRSIYYSDLDQNTNTFHLKIDHRYQNINEVTDNICCMNDSLKHNTAS